MAKAKQTKAPPQESTSSRDFSREELRVFRQAEFIQSFGDVAKQALRSLVWISLFYFSYLSIDSLSGKETAATILVQFFASIEADRWIAYGVGILGMSVGIRYRKLYKRHVRNTSPYVEELEVKIDPKRTSSHLSKTGDTKEGD